MSRFLSPKSLENVCIVSKQACDIMTPMVLSFYNAINGETSKLKSDKSVFTIADGIVQHLLVNSLFGANFDAVVGEEEENSVNITTRPYTVEDLTVPEEFYDVIDSVRNNIVKLSSQLEGHDYKNISVFIDPIDGTREFSTNLGEQCSICIGFSRTAGDNADNKPVAGIVYRPITQPPTWAAGAASEDICMSNLDCVEVAKENGFLTSNGSISKFIEVLMGELSYDRVPSGGAGNKMLMLLEGKGNCYIQDRGVSRWDTCAAQAVIEAFGGGCFKLSNFINNNMEYASYAYKKSTDNTDFVPGLSCLTPYNVRDKNAIKKGEKNVPANDINVVKPYSNLNGILAIDKQTLSSPDKMKALYDAIIRSKATHEPAYD